ncbi:unnamed protein product [Prunus armeniaca]
MEEFPIFLGKPVYRSQKKNPIVVLEAVASYDTWIWLAFFGAAGSNNDINILACSPLFNDVVHGVAPHVECIINGINTIWATIWHMGSTPVGLLW